MRGVPARHRSHTDHHAPSWHGGSFGPVGAAFDPAGHGAGRAGDGYVGGEAVALVAPAPMRAAVALASSLLVGIGVFLPWQIVHFEDQRRSFRGWNLAAGDARACVVFALIGLVAAWSLTTVRGIWTALFGRLALLAAGGAAVGVAALEAVRLGDRLQFPGLRSRPGFGLVVVGVGALGLIGAGAWAAWRPAPGVEVPGPGSRHEGSPPERPD